MSRIASVSANGDGFAPRGSKICRVLKSASIVNCSSSCSCRNSFLLATHINTGTNRLCQRSKGIGVDSGAMFVGNRRLSFVCCTLLRFSVGHLSFKANRPLMGTDRLGARSVVVPISDSRHSTVDACFSGLSRLVALRRHRLRRAGACGGALTGLLLAKVIQMRKWRRGRLTRFPTNDEARRGSVPSRAVFGRHPRSRSQTLGMVRQLNCAVIPHDRTRQGHNSQGTILFARRLRAFLDKRACRFNDRAECFSKKTVTETVRTISRRDTTKLCTTGGRVCRLVYSNGDVRRRLPSNAQRSFSVHCVSFRRPRGGAFRIASRFRMRHPGKEFTHPSLIILMGNVPLIMVRYGGSDISIVRNIVRGVQG